MKSKILVATLVFSLMTAIGVYARDTAHTGGYKVISNASFQGQSDKRHGWPVKVKDLDDAIRKARSWSVNAFTLAQDRMWPLYNVTGYETPKESFNVMGVIMEREN